MKIRVKLLLLREIDQRNARHIEAYKETRKPPAQQRKKKPMRNKGRHRKKPE